MRLLILGASGMLGHTLTRVYRDSLDTWAAVRGEAARYAEYRILPDDRIIGQTNAVDLDTVVRAVAAVKPDVVVNCIGIIKQTREAKDPIASLLVNALFPHRLAGICEAARSRLIHVSTDCVFSGTRGHYMESDISDAVDLYGRTKFLGELNYPHTVTLRTSIIGRELKSRLGLVEWFLAQQGTVRGYERAMYSGLTTLEMAAVIRDHVIWNRDLRGVYHVSSEPISKYRLLQLVKEVFRKDIEILPDSVLFCDRSLDSSRFRQATGYVSRSWKEMIVDLTDAPELYNPLPRVGSC